MPLFKEPRHFIIVTKDFSGLGFAERLSADHESVVLAHRVESDKGEPVPPGAKLVGRGITPLTPFDDIFKDRAKFKNAYWIFDQNHFFKEGEMLRKEGFPRVFGGQKLTYDMEHDREFGVNIVKKAGIKSPETVDFRDVLQGVQFLDHNPDKAYVFKPNENGNGWSTFVPDSEKDNEANDELHAYLDSLPSGNTGGYILQERIRGVEVNFELWLHKGKPYFAIGDLECKMKNNDDMGAMCGGSQDINFPVPLDCKGIRETVEKLLPQFKDYTGFLDMNVIVHDNGPYFLEFCARWGYPMHPTAFLALARDPMGDILAEMIDGPKGNFYDHFKYGFGAGITLYSPDARKGIPIKIPDDLRKYFFAFDTYKKVGSDLLLTAGVGDEVGIITGHGFTPMDAAEEALQNLRKIRYPSREARTDLDKDSYRMNPRDRYIALEAMRYLIP